MAIRSERFIDKTNIINFHHTREVDFQIPVGIDGLRPTIRNILIQELSSNILYKTVWLEAKTEFEKKRKFLEQQNVGKAKIWDEAHISVIAYTSNKDVYYLGKERKLYQHFNEECRKLIKSTQVKNFPYKSLYFMLIEGHRGIKSNPDWNQPLYRGVTIYYKPSTLKQSVLCNFDQYTSWTIYKHKALEFIEDSEEGTGTLLKIEAPMAGYGIANYSYHPNEAEVLVCPWSTFTINKVKQKDSIHEIDLNNGNYPYLDNKLPYARVWI